jgi:hypothetical protein
MAQADLLTKVRLQGLPDFPSEPLLLILLHDGKLLRTAVMDRDGLDNKVHPGAVGAAVKPTPTAVRRYNLLHRAARLHPDEQVQNQ